ncbi:MAG: threonine-phosphate decarboxylase [Betaproteobacteria bacterium HGW-Betaproteobacteria-11]|nr:MAG: threonine-phosphate decarboxylase [Betaproteobacteria bacterium HGW-Betaproteobacteria-11]
MILLSIVITLLLEQIRPLAVERTVRSPVAKLAEYLERRFNDGVYLHGAIAWGIGAALPALILLAGQLLAYHVTSLLWLLLAVGTLYLTMGFRQFSHFFTEIHAALRLNDLTRARQVLAAWRGYSGDNPSSSEVARLAIEEALLLAHRYVFAPLFWFAVLGPAGAVLYRLTHLLNEFWNRPVLPGSLDPGDFGCFARQAFATLDGLPVRITAATFAVVGNFEDAVDCWRNQASRWPDRGSGILLASGAGALGVRLGMPMRGGVRDLDGADDRPELGVGEEADAGFMQSTIGLVWRSLVLVLAVLALIWISSWAGG